MKHTLVALVENKPGVLNRVASLFRRRNFNIESLAVGETENPAVSRMTIVIDANTTSVALVERNLYKLVNVIQVMEVTNQPHVQRDLALVKVKATPQVRGEIMQFVTIYRANIVDVSMESVIVEITGPEDKVNSFIDLMRPFGIKELVRTGIVAMARGDGGGNFTENGNGQHETHIEQPNGAWTDIVDGREGV